MDQIITFDKSLQERLNEYLDVLSHEKWTPAQIKKEWSFYLEFSIDSNGWQAVWKIPRLTCEKLKIPFPAIVIVYVEDINFVDLMAKVKIIAVQDDISLPESHLVSLLQIWPTREQDKSVVLNMKSTANSLDMYRFYYTNIFMPWDDDYDEHYDWLNKHLESRLRLFYDLKNGVIPRVTAEHIRALLTEARRLQAKREEIELIFREDLIDSDPNDKQVQEMLDLNVKMLQIKGEIELLENPVTRNILIKRHLDQLPKKNSIDPTFWLVMEEGTIDDYIIFLNQVKQLYTNDIVKCVPLLNNVLDNLKVNDTIILNKNRYVLTSNGALENGGYMTGIYQKEDTILVSDNETMMLDFSGDVTLKNLTIDAKKSQCGLLVRKGKTTLRNCKFIGDNLSSTHQGIIVLKDSELELIDCDISGFGTAIVGNSGSKIFVENSIIYNVSYGIKVYDFCVFTAKNCTFHDCNEHAVCVETDHNVSGDQRVGNFEMLQVIPDVVLTDTNGTNNAKGDVIINQKAKILPITDLFADTNLIAPVQETHLETTDTEEKEVCDEEMI